MPTPDQVGRQPWRETICQDLGERVALGIDVEATTCAIFCPATCRYGPSLPAAVDCVGQTTPTRTLETVSASKNLQT